MLLLSFSEQSKYMKVLQEVHGRYNEHIGLFWGKTFHSSRGLFMMCIFYKLLEDFSYA